MTSSYRILDQVAVADTAFEAVGTTPTELCQVAGRAVMELMADPDTVGATSEYQVECASDTLADVLFDWLNQLVFLKDAHGVVFHDARVVVTRRKTAPRWRLRAVVSGAPVDASTQELRADLKAVTRHLYKVSRDGSGWRARVVVDV